MPGKIDPRVIEKAWGLRIECPELTHEEIAEKVGRGHRTVQNYFRREWLSERGLLHIADRPPQPEGGEAHQGNGGLSIQVSEDEVQVVGTLNIVDEALGLGGRGDREVRIPMTLTPRGVQKIDLLELRVEDLPIPPISAPPEFVRKAHCYAPQFVVPSKVGVGKREGTIWMLVNLREIRSAPFTIDFRRGA